MTRFNLVQNINSSHIPYVMSCENTELLSTFIILIENNKGVKTHFMLLVAFINAVLYYLVF